MNYLMFIDRITKYNPIQVPVQFLVSGNDPAIRRTVLNDVVQRAYRCGQTLIVVDDMGDSGLQNLQDIAAAGYRVRNGMSGEYCIYNPFQIGTVKGMRRMRQILSTLEYDEKRKIKLIAYLNFVRYVEELESGSNAELSLSTLTKYSTSLRVEMNLQYLADGGIISEKKREHLVIKYSEICEAAADFEDMLFVLAPFIAEGSEKPGDTNGQAIVLPIEALGEDIQLRNLIMLLLQFGIEEGDKRAATMLIMDRGYGDRRCILNLLKSLPPEVSVHIFSEDIFTLCDTSMLAILHNRFTARVYGRHLSMDSCLAIEKVCGDVDVVKNSHTVNYDRRWHANRPWDILMGNKKSESYTRCVPTREPRYRKEMISGFSPGNGIIEYLGNTSIFSV